MKRLALLFALLGGGPPPVLATLETYVADVAHSSIGFSVRNVVIRTSGRFTSFTATLQVDPADPAHNTVTAEIPIASIDTGEPKRDHHLQQPEFFDAAKFPTMTFRSTQWTRTAARDFDIAGTLTLRGVTKPVVLHARLLETSPTRLRWEAKATLNRHDYGVSADRSMIGADVDITITLVTQRKP